MLRYDRLTDIEQLANEQASARLKRCCNRWLDLNDTALTFYCRSQERIVRSSSVADLVADGLDIDGGVPRSTSAAE